MNNEIGSSITRVIVAHERALIGDHVSPDTMAAIAVIPDFAKPHERRHILNCPLCRHWMTEHRKARQHADAQEGPI